MARRSRGRAPRDVAPKQSTGASVALAPDPSPGPQTTTQLAELVALAPALLAVGAMSAALGWLPGLGLSPAMASPDRIYDTRFGLVGIGVGATVAALGLRARRALALAPVGLALALFALGVLEDRSAVAAYHRAVMRPFGFGPDAWLALCWGALLHAARERGARSGLGLLGAAVFIALLVSPAAVAGTLTPGLLAFSGDPVDAGDRLGRWLLPWLHLSIAGAAVGLALVPTWRARLTPVVLLAPFALWALLTGALGSEGWVEPLWRWPVLSHVLVRGAVLLAVAVACAGLLAQASEARAQARRICVVAATAIAIVFLLVKLQTVHWSKTDENIYFYAAHALWDGVLPYRDYFYAHPPLRVLLPALVFGVGGFSVVSAKLLPVLGALLAGFCASRIATRVVEVPAREVAGLLAGVLVLANERVLVASTEMTGVNMATGFACAGLLLAYRGRPAWAGVAAVAAIGVGMVQLWMVPVIIATVLLRPPGEGAKGQVEHGMAQGLLALRERFMPALLVGVMVVFGGAFLVGGAKFVTSVFTFHSLKAPTDPDYVALGGNPIVWPVALFQDLYVLFAHGALRSPFDNNPLGWLGGAVAMVYLPWSLWRTRATLGVRSAEYARRLAHWTPLLAGLPLSIVFVALLRERYDFYWSAFMPIPAILAAVALAQLGLGLIERPSAARLCGLVLLLLPTQAVAHWGMLEGAERSSAGAITRLPFRPSSPTRKLDALTASLLYKPYLVRGELEAPMHRFFWAKKKSFEAGAEIAAAVREHTPAESTITGSSTVAPLVALLAGRRMAANEVDTNGKVFSTGLRSEVDFWRRACADHVAAVVVADGFFPPEYMRKDNPVAGQFRKLRSFSDPMLRWGTSYSFELWTLAEGRSRCAVDASAVPGD